MVTRTTAFDRKSFENKKGRLIETPFLFVEECLALLDTGQIPGRTVGSRVVAEDPVLLHLVGRCLHAILIFENRGDERRAAQRHRAPVD